MRHHERAFITRKRCWIKLGPGVYVYLAKGQEFEVILKPRSSTLEVEVYAMYILEKTVLVDSRQLDDLVDDGIIREYS